MLHSEVYQKNLVGFVVDEVHGVKKWYVCCIHVHPIIMYINNHPKSACTCVKVKNWCLSTLLNVKINL